MPSWKLLPLDANQLAAEYSIAALKLWPTSRCSRACAQRSLADLPESTTGPKCTLRIRQTPSSRMSQNTKLQVLPEASPSTTPWACSPLDFIATKTLSSGLEMVPPATAGHRTMDSVPPPHNDCKK